MEQFDLQVLHRLPLAEAVYRLLAFGLDPVFLEQLYDRHRGSSYTKAISFATLTHLVSDALFAGRSGLATFQKGQADGTLPASIEALYGKLRRVPAAVSIALLEHTAQRLEALFPAGRAAYSLPTALASFTGLVIDGKVSKGVPHRLKALRQAKGGLIGGRALVAYHLGHGHVLSLHGEEDGDANDVRFFPTLAEKLRQRLTGQRLWVADRQFATLPTLTLMQQDVDAFIVRYSKSVSFHVDADRPARHGVDEEQRPVVQEWGWLGQSQKRPGLYVRRLTVSRAGTDPLVVLTSLLDAEHYPAVAVLDVYRHRTDIEYVFERITEIFQLRRLIGTSPRATLFQLSLCLLLYNVLQLVRGYVAAANDKTLEQVSPKKLLEEVREEMIALLKVLSKETIVDGLGRPLSSEELSQLLRVRLARWEKRWSKAARRRHRPPKPRKKSGHACAHRILMAAQEAAQKECS
jgi:Transposase DDE domain